MERVYAAAGGNTAGGGRLLSSREGAKNLGEKRRADRHPPITVFGSAHHEPLERGIAHVLPCHERGPLHQRQTVPALDKHVCAPVDFETTLVPWPTVRGNRKNHSSVRSQEWME
jgi:hypothetical protein